MPAVTGRTVTPLLNDASARLAAAGVPSPRVDAELLLAHVLGVSRSRLVLVPHVDVVSAAAYDAALVRRAAREPLQHIVGTAAFRGVEVRVGPGVFVPRPETELLVDAVLPVLRAAPQPRALDLCAGSGALALAILDEVPAARVVAVEQPGPALAWLQSNTAGTTVQVISADVTAVPVPDLARLTGRCDVVVSNPPYVPSGAAVTAEVRHDPSVAVFAGRDGLSVLPAVVERAGQLLRSGGVLAVEHDDSQPDAVVHLLEADGRFTGISARRDLADRPRYAVAVRR